MSAKMSAARRAAFLKGLAETGNVTVSAERAKVSRSWVQLHRSTDPEFDSACRAAVAEARERLSGHGERRPPSGWGFAGGEELVVRGTGGARPSTRSGPARGRRVQVARARIRQWTGRAERRFLEALAATCNVKAACAAVGLTPASAYGHRNRWPAFARQWDEALETGALKLDLAIIETAKNIFSDAPPDLSLPIPDMTFDQAIQALRLHQRRLSGTGGRPGRLPVNEPDIEEVRAEVLRKVAVMEKARARGWRG